MSTRLCTYLNMPSNLESSRPTKRRCGHISTRQQETGCQLRPGRIPQIVVAEASNVAFALAAPFQSFDHTMPDQAPFSACAYAQQHSPTRDSSASDIINRAVARLAIDAIDSYYKSRHSCEVCVPFTIQIADSPTLKTMGNEESKPQTLYRRISKALPPIAPQYGVNENSDWVDKGTKAFASDGDRDQFICQSRPPQRLQSRDTSVRLTQYDPQMA